MHPGRRTAVGIGNRGRVIPGAAIAKHDKDSDKTPDLDEVKSAAAARFYKLNKNRNCPLEDKEVKGILGERAFQTADPDNNSSLSKDEYMALVEKLFEKTAPDCDGTLDATELKSRSGTTLRKLIGKRLAAARSRPDP